MYPVTLARAGVQGQRGPTLVKVEMKMSTDAGCRGLMETEADIRVLCQRFATRSRLQTLIQWTSQVLGVRVLLNYLTN